MYFSLVATATTDEGNNWINMRWGPLSLTNPSQEVTTADPTYTPIYLGNYAIGAASGAVDRGIAAVAGVASPSTDFFGNPRPDRPGSNPDIGAVEYQAPLVAVAAVRRRRRWPSVPFSMAAAVPGR